MRVELSDYQVEAKDFLLSHAPFAALYDSPGVGKSFPGIAAAWELREPGKPILITCPTFLTRNWSTEIRRLYPEATISVVEGAGYIARYDALMADVDIVISGYYTWSATKKQGGYLYPEIAKRPWSAMLYDEAHRLRGYRTQGTKHVFQTRLATAPNRETPIFFLTGTPFVRDGSDFYTAFHLYDKKRFSSYWRFVEDRCIVTKTPWKTDVGNIKRSYQAEFRKELAEFSLRRTTADIPQLADLEYIEIEYLVNMPKSVLKMMQTMKKEYILEHPDLDSPEFLSGSGAVYTKLRQLATLPPTKENPKVGWLKDFLTDKKGKVVVYVYYRESAKVIADAIGAVGPISGDLPAAKRMELVDTWRSPSGPQVLVATIPSLNEGISLTEASEIVFLEHTPLPSDIEQTIKRLCRRGQKNVVQVHHVRADKTVDMVTKKVLESRNLGITEALAKYLATEEEESDEWFV